MSSQPLQRSRHLLFTLLLCWVVIICMPHCGPEKGPPDEQKASDEKPAGETSTTTEEKNDGSTGQPDTITQPDQSVSPDTPTPTPDRSTPTPDKTTPDTGTTDIPTADTPTKPDARVPPDTRVTPETTNPNDQVTPPERRPPEQPKATTKIALKASIVSGKTGQLLVSNGVPFAAGVVTSNKQYRLLINGNEIPIFTKSLAKWQDGSIRAALIQFQRNATSFPANLVLEVGAARSTTDRKEVAVTWTLPQAVAFPTAIYISNSLAFGRLIPLNADKKFAKYDANAVLYYNQHKGTKDWGNDARRDGYYSTTLTWYLLFLRSADIERYQWARREAVHYRNDQITKTGSKAGTMNGRNEPRYLYMQAMEIDYLLNGDPKTLQVAGLMAKYLQGLHPASWYLFRKTETRFWTERRAAFPLLGLTVYGRWTGDKTSLQMAKQILDRILDTQAQWPDGGWIHNLYAHDSAECGTRSAYGGSPFMTGLMFEALIVNYLWTKDKRIVPSIKKATDWLWSKGWKSTGFLYLIGCGTRYKDPVPDLNLLIAHGFAFTYWANGKKAADMKRAWDVFNQGVTNAYLKTRKHYNQNYRSSYAFPWFMTK